MARRGWGVSIATAVGIAAGAGAAQLGFGYGLGVITWTPTDAGATDTAWADGLAWATWLAASSTVLGAVCAQRLHQRAVPPTADPRVTDNELTPTAVPGTEAPDGSDAPEPATVAAGRPTAVDDTGPDRPTSAGDRSAHEVPPGEHDGLLRRVAVALGAGIGGLVTVLLVAVPARVAVGADTGAPQRAAALHAGLGILIGVLVAVWALRSRTAAVNVTATAAWLWLLAVVSVVDGVRVGRGLTGAQLGTWQLDPDHPRYWIGDQLYWPGALLALVPALLIGVLAARRAARSAGHRVGAAASGAAGPLLVALAYLTTVPRWSVLGPEQLSTQLIAPYAVIAGIGGSVLIAALAERADRNRDAAATAGPHPVAEPSSPRSHEVAPAPVSPSAEAGAGRDSVGDVPPVDEVVPGKRAGVPRVPAPRRDPDDAGPTASTDGGPAEGAATGSRRSGSPRRAGRPLTD
ncbi:hypothetical protein M8C17_14650 [Micromonospora sp. RHAY321]|uniref:hypothetical protein n=1 Tax=Micromonospora sp. RHAY321 TaxID=2944807 RepID=UPI00207CCF68|nr:hypothetical protein [Micromonospora sp. RHAY321]MCO1596397.1 hypothetical protein [Micromonospora sp. RHAY321]